MLSIEEHVERATRDALCRAARMRQKISGVSPSLNPDRMQSSGCDRSVPTDAQCWLLDIEKLVMELGNPKSSAFVHIAAPRILVGSLVHGMKKSELTRGTCVKRNDVDVLLDRATVSFFVTATSRGLMLDLDDYIAA